MPIHKLPDYVINRLKAGEIVERPASVLKELVENSLDAGATEIQVSLNDGGKSLLSVEDNGCGIELSDMDLLLERYATSKIQTDEDLFHLQSYGFRGEALASISEVSKLTVISKTAYAEIGTKVTKRGQEFLMKHLPVSFPHGTLVSVEDLFFNVPARLKFLKSSQTEFYYCYNYFVDVALWHYDKAFRLIKNDKVTFDLKPVRELKERITDIFKKDWSQNLKNLIYQDEKISLKGVVSDPGLRFGSGENIKIYVNGRPVQDKIIRKALMDAYARQITPGEYPFAVLMLEIDPEMVDVNVHPSKLQVKFSDSQKIFQVVYDTVAQALGANKIASFSHSFQGKTSSQGHAPIFDQVVDSLKGMEDISAHEEKTISTSTPLFEGLRDGKDQISVSQPFSLDFESGGQEVFFHQDIGDFQIVGQLWNSYIALQAKEALYYIDQHALAERIAYEHMKKSQDFSSEILLQPLKFEISNIPDLEEKIEELNQCGFDCSLLGENVLVVYAIPKVFVVYPVDIVQLLNHVFYLEKITFDHIFDGVYATKACKTSIKAGHKLSYQQMQHLVLEGFEAIPGMFVCQHGRPFFVRIEKSEIDGFFDR